MIQVTHPILIVDDYVTMLRILGNLLGQVGCKEVISASGGEEALQRLRETPISAVICDWNMEPVSGYELLRRIRGDAQISKIPFIMISADASPERISAATAAGCSAFLVKPFNAAKLGQTLQETLPRRAA